MSDAASDRATACATVWRKYPALANVQPTVRTEGDGSVFTFKAARAAGGSGPPVALVVRVTVGTDGRVRRVVAAR